MIVSMVSLNYFFTSSFCQVRTKTIWHYCFWKKKKRKIVNENIEFIHTTMYYVNDVYYLSSPNYKKNVLNHEYSSYQYRMELYIQIIIVQIHYCSIYVSKYLVFDLKKIIVSGLIDSNNNGHNKYYQWNNVLGYWYWSSNWRVIIRSPPPPGLRTTNKFSNPLKFWACFAYSIARHLPKVVGKVIRDKVVFDVVFYWLSFRYSLR